jgi:hypothetical protein
MATALLTNSKANGYSAEQLMQGPSTVFVRGNLVGANVAIEVRSTTALSEWDEVGRALTPDTIVVDQEGPYYVRAGQFNSHVNSSVTVEVEQ